MLAYLFTFISLLVLLVIFLSLRRRFFPAFGRKNGSILITQDDLKEAVVKGDFSFLWVIGILSGFIFLFSSFFSWLFSKFFASGIVDGENAMEISSLAGVLGFLMLCALLLSVLYRSRKPSLAITAVFIAASVTTQFGGLSNLENRYAKNEINQSVVSGAAENLKRNIQLQQEHEARGREAREEGKGKTAWVAEQRGKEKADEIARDQTLIEKTIEKVFFGRDIMVNKISDFTGLEPGSVSTAINLTLTFLIDALVSITLLLLVAISSVVVWFSRNEDVIKSHWATYEQVETEQLFQRVHQRNLQNGHRYPAKQHTNGTYRNGNGVVKSVPQVDQVMPESKRDQAAREIVDTVDAQPSEKKNDIGSASQAKIDKANERRDVVIAMLEKAHAENRHITNVDIANAVGYDPSSVSKIRKQWAEDSAHLNRGERERKLTKSQRKQLVYDLYRDEPELSVSQVADRAGISVQTVKGYYAEMGLNHEKEALLSSYYMKNK